MSISRGMDTEVVVLIYNGILLSHKKEWNSAISRDVDRTRDCHTEWSKLEREKQISYNIAYMWNLEKWYRWTYFQSRNRDTDVENKLMDTQGKGGRGMNWEIGIDIYTLLCIKYVTNEYLLYNTGNSKMFVPSLSFLIQPNWSLLCGKIW